MIASYKKETNKRKLKLLFTAKYTEKTNMRMDSFLFLWVVAKIEIYSLIYLYVKAYIH